MRNIECGVRKPGVQEVLFVHSLLLIGWFLWSMNLGCAPVEVVINPPRAEKVPQYALFEATLTTNVGSTNPFDPRQVDLQVRFTTPSGEEHTMPAFYDEAEGQPVWSVRYTPTRVGQYRYYATLNGGCSRTYVFECIPSEREGFVRVSSEDHRYFQHDSGKAYFAIGHNVCWAEDYAYYFRQMAAHGENYTRLWLAHSDLALEWSREDSPGLGRYHLGKAARLDRILKLAEQSGVYLVFCVESFNSLRHRLVAMARSQLLNLVRSFS